MGLLGNKRLICLRVVEELNGQTQGKHTQQCLAHRKDSNNTSGYYSDAGACSLETLVELVLLTAFTLLRTQSLLQMKADATGSI